MDGQTASLHPDRPIISPTAQARAGAKAFPWLWSGLLIVVLGFLVLYPTLMLLIGALTTTNPVVDGVSLSDVSVSNFLVVAGNPNVLAALGNSLLACGGGTLLAVAIGLSFAWVVVRNCSAPPRRVPF